MKERVVFGMEESKLAIVVPLSKKQSLMEKSLKTFTVDLWITALKINQRNPRF
jgi:hypothetical protein